MCIWPFCLFTYHKPRMEYDTEGQVKSREHQHGSEPRQQYGNQSNPKHIGVEEHQQNDDEVKQDGNVLDSVEEKKNCK